MRHLPDLQCKQTLRHRPSRASIIEPLINDVDKDWASEQRISWLLSFSNAHKL